MATYMSRSAARDYLHDEHGVVLGESALENKASSGTGPAFSKINGRALYKRSDLDAWVSAEATKPVKRRADAVRRTVSLT